MRRHLRPGQRQLRLARLRPDQPRLLPRLVRRHLRPEQPRQARLGRVSAALTYGQSHYGSVVFVPIYGRPEQLRLLHSANSCWDIPSTSGAAPRSPPPPEHHDSAALIYGLSHFGYFDPCCAALTHGQRFKFIPSRGAILLRSSSLSDGVSNGWQLSQR